MKIAPRRAKGPAGAAVRRSRLRILEAAREQLGQSGHRGVLIRAVGNDSDRGLIGGPQGDDAHDGLSVDPFAPALENDVARERAGGLHQLGGRPGMDAGPVDDENFAFDQRLPLLCRDGPRTTRRPPPLPLRNLPRRYHSSVVQPADDRAFTTPLS